MKKKKDYKGRLNKMQHRMRETIWVFGWLINELKYPVCNCYTCESENAKEFMWGIVWYVTTIFTMET